MFIDNLNLLSFNFEKHKFSNIQLDAITAQDITLENVISEHPLETGELLNDAIHNLPIKVNFSAVVSDLAQNYQEELESIADHITSVFSSKKLRTSKSIRAWQDLYALWKSKQLVSITTPIAPFKPFSSMAIKSITVNLDSTLALNFSANLYEVVIAENLKKFDLAPEVGKQSIRP